MNARTIAAVDLIIFKNDTAIGVWFSGASSDANVILCLLGLVFVISHAFNLARRVHHWAV
jgi:hypothetical protein